MTVLSRAVWTALGASVILGGTLDSVAQAQSPAAQKTYPTRPIRLILPQSPGGPTDIIGRLIAQKLGDNLGQTVVPDNRAGAAGSVGCEIAETNTR